MRGKKLVQRTENILEQRFLPLAPLRSGMIVADAHRHARVLRRHKGKDRHGAEIGMDDLILVRLERPSQGALIAENVRIRRYSVYSRAKGAKLTLLRAGAPLGKVEIKLYLFPVYMTVIVHQNCLYPAAVHSVEDLRDPDLCTHFYRLLTFDIATR